MLNWGLRSIMFVFSETKTKKISKLECLNLVRYNNKNESLIFYEWQVVRFLKIHNVLGKGIRVQLLCRNQIFVKDFLQFVIGTLNTTRI